MGTAYGRSGQSGTITIGSVGPLQCTRIRPKKGFHNADTTVSDNAWAKICPVYRDWSFDVEMPMRSADASNTIVDAFDTDYFASAEDVSITSISGTIGSRSFSGSGALDGEVEIDNAATDAVRLRFTIKGSDALTWT